jgi:hypothetical protein
MRAEIAAPGARIVFAKGDLKSCFSIGSICHGVDCPLRKTSDLAAQCVATVARRYRSSLLFATHYNFVITRCGPFRRCCNVTKRIWQIGDILNVLKAREQSNVAGMRENHG